MKIATLALALLVGASSIAHGKSDSEIRAEADANLMTVARWGVCLLDKLGDETQAKGMVYPVVMKVDDAFVRKYGMKATDVARERYGSDFVKVYYDRAKAGFQKSDCAAANERVLALVK